MKIPGQIVDLVNWPGTQRLALGDVALSLAADVCGYVYLVAVWSSWASSHLKKSPRWIDSRSWPLRIACETGSDDWISFLNLF